MVDVILITDGLRDSGIVAVNRNGHWGVICDREWGHREASVVCLMLGYTGASMATRSHDSDLDVVLRNVQCSEEEATIQECSYLLSSVCNPHSFGKAGVQCSNITTGMLDLYFKR